MEVTKRFFAFWLRFLLALVLIAGIAVLTFFTASDYSNLRVVVSDGLEARAEAVLMQTSAEEREELNKFFSTDFLVKDALLQQSEYSEYVVSAFEHTVDVEKCFAWPWQNETVVRIVERIPVIDGQIRDEYKTEEQKKKGEKVSPPAWKAGRYNVTMKRIDGHWMIDKMILIQEVANAEATPTVMPEESSTPTASAS